MIEGFIGLIAGFAGIAITIMVLAFIGILLFTIFSGVGLVLAGIHIFVLLVLGLVFLPILLPVLIPILLIGALLFLFFPASQAVC